MRSRFLIVHNPNAGSGKRRLLDETVAALHREGCAVTIREATCDRSDRAIAEQASVSGAFDAVVAAGGDGTARGLASALRGTDIPIGLIPLGTGNVMATEIGLPRHPERIAACLRHGAAIPARGALANGAPFFLMAGAGLDGEAVAALDPRLKKRIGKLAYVWPTTRAVLRRSSAIEVVLDDTTHRASWVVVCKAGRYAGGFLLSPDSHMLTPGLIAVMSAARTRFGLIADILTVGAGFARRAPNLRFVPFRRAHLRGERHVAVQVDGERFGQLPLTIAEDNVPVTFLVPSREAAAARHDRRAAA